MTPTQAETAENEWNEIRPLIDTALESLSEEDRGIIISRHLQQMSLKDAGTVLGINEDAAGKAGGQGRLPGCAIGSKAVESDAPAMFSAGCWEGSRWFLLRRNSRSKSFRLRSETPPELRPVMPRGKRVLTGCPPARPWWRLSRWR